MKLKRQKMSDSMNLKISVFYDKSAKMFWKKSEVFP